MKEVSFLIIILNLVLFGCSQRTSDKTKKFQTEGQKAFEAVSGLGAVKTKQQKVDPTLAEVQAKTLFRNLQIEGVDISNGPCLSNDLMPDWVADIAHNPRQPIDNLPENQCSAFLEGKAHHFIELDLDGNLIRTQ
jgi:hypothetical protein